jgi:hypothetical protein
MATFCWYSKYPEGSEAGRLHVFAALYQTFSVAVSVTEASQSTRMAP